MAKTSSVEKQKKRERLVQLKWNKRQELKKIIANMNLSEEERFQARIALNKLSPNSSPVRLKNRCQLTGRSRGYLRKFRMSRLCFRELALMGMIPGIVILVSIAIITTWVCGKSDDEICVTRPFLTSL